MDFKEYLDEGEVKLSGNIETSQKLKDLKLSVDDWIRAAEVSDESQTSKFIILKSIKSINSNLKSVAKAIDNAIKMEQKYKGKA
jgi:hypothetical protein